MTTQPAVAGTPPHARILEGAAARLLSEYPATAPLITGYASNYGVFNGRYIVAAGAFVDLVRRGAMPKMLLNHEGPEIGEWLTIDEDERGLYVTGKLWDNRRAREAISLYRSSELPGLSLGPKRRCRWKTMRCGIRLVSHIEAIDEISLVGVPMDPMALIESYCNGTT
ncbi:HK97 family phage prohead protease [Mesorhizobium sp.]|uniref:HK97 family phage prohead protease n=1 Tax=Mesorhizobium sp. TaxID=1871066 RepID=UPI0025B8F248|nr:HK97 family phage prohead protease [Mesorhizobium sp.]